MKSTKTQTQPPGRAFPHEYRPVLDPISTARAMQQLKTFIELNLETEMQLHRVSAPLFVQKGTGVNDNLNGIERPVCFSIKAMNIEAEVVQSLAKWKRMALAAYELPVHEGIYTDMHAIRADEIPDNLHSVFVDQWDWEKRIVAGDRSLEYLKETVKKLFLLLKRAEVFISKNYDIAPMLPDQIYFIHAEELLQRYPELPPVERENEIVREYGAVFIIGIGGLLSNGRPHDGRSPDYDDWSSPNGEGYNGLNGDILVWHPVLERALELSSMGIRVDKESLLRQLVLKDQKKRVKLHFHQLLLNDELPLSIGGGIGQSRTGMYFLRKVHIGEISTGLWPDKMVRNCKAHGVRLL